MRRAGYVLNVECENFWLIGGESASEFALSFAKGFLHKHEERTRLLPPFPIIPKPVSDLEVFDAFRTLSYSRLSWADAVCEKCGRCNQRRLWSIGTKSAPKLGSQRLMLSARDCSGQQIQSDRKNLQQMPKDQQAGVRARLDVLQR